MDYIKEKISVIVPIYNVEKYLAQCVDSIINQTYDNLEIILVDDGSTDSCRYICDKYEKTDKRIKVIHKSNGGLSTARNSGIKNSTSKYLFFVDSDDYLDINTIDILYRDMIINDADISCCSCYRFYDNGNKEANGRSENDFYIFDRNQALEFMLSDNGLISAWGKMYKASLFNDTKYVQIVYEDLEIMPKLLKDSKIITYRTKPLYYWRYNDNSLSNTVSHINLVNRLLSYKLSIDYVSINYPNLTNNIKKTYIIAAINYLYKTIGFKEMESQRNELRKDIITTFKNSRINLDNNYFYQLFALKINLKFYDFCHIFKTKTKNKFNK